MLVSLVFVLTLLSVHLNVKHLSYSKKCQRGTVEPLILKYDLQPEKTAPERRSKNWFCNNIWGNLIGSAQNFCHQELPD